MKLSRGRILNHDICCSCPWRCDFWFQQHFPKPKRLHSLLLRFTSSSDVPCSFLPSYNTQKYFKWELCTSIVPAHICKRNAMRGFFVVLACHQLVLDGFDHHFLAFAHFPLTSHFNRSQQYQNKFFGTLRIKPWSSA